MASMICLFKQLDTILLWHKTNGERLDSLSIVHLANLFTANLQQFPYSPQEHILLHLPQHVAQYRIFTGIQQKLGLNEMYVYCIKIQF